MIHTDKTGRFKLDDAVSHTYGNATSYIIDAAFDGIGDVLDFIASNEAVHASGIRLSSIESDYNFTGTRNMAEAVNLARAGWPEGRAKMLAALSLAAAATAPRQAMKTRYDVAGEAPDVGRYLAGDPACMVNRARATDRRKPVIRVLASVGAPSMCETSHMINRGAAILAQVDAWEESGWSVELELIQESHFLRSRDDSRPRSMPNAPMADYIVNYHVMLKRAGEQLELDRVAFALIHPSMLRRLCFAIDERLDTTKMSNSAHGRTIDLLDVKPNGEAPQIITAYTDSGPLVYLPPIQAKHVEANTFSTAEMAVAAVTPYFERAIYHNEAA